MTKQEQTELVEKAEKLFNPTTDEHNKFIIEQYDTEAGLAVTAHNFFARIDIERALLFSSENNMILEVRTDNETNEPSIIFYRTDNDGFLVDQDTAS